MKTDFVDSWTQFQQLAKEAGQRRDIVVVRVEMPPHVAQDILDRCSLATDRAKARHGEPIQRPINWYRVHQYLRLMQRGEWSDNVGDLSVTRTTDPRGFKLLNGYHRLNALAKGGGTVESCAFIFKFNMPFEEVLNEDTGGSRTEAQVLGFAGESVPSQNTANSVINMIFRHRRGIFPTSGRFKPTTRERVELMHELEGTLSRHVELVTSMPSRPVGLRKAVFGFADWYFCQAGEADAAELFWEAFKERSGRPDEGPRLLRDKAERENYTQRISDQTELLMHVVRTFNAFLNGERLGKLQLPRDFDPSKATLPPVG